MAKIILFLYIMATSTALILLKLGTHGGAPVEYANSRLHLNLNPQVLGGMVLYGISFSLYTYLIAKNELGYIIPITAALVYLIVFTASYFVFKESFNTMKIIGISMIIIGVLLLNFKK